jgi:hypothetical protein
MRRTALTRVGIGAMAVAVLVAGANALFGAAPTTRVMSSASSTSSTHAETFSVAPASARETPTSIGASAAAPLSPALVAGTRMVPVLEPGRTEWRDGRFAERTGDSVVVHFDTPVFRTRRRDKFEQGVRATLPLVFGAVADSMLADVPAGTLGGTADLLADLPGRGVRLPARYGWAIRLWPGVRPGQDGPLVVTYRVSVEAVR